MTNQTLTTIKPASDNRAYAGFFSCCATRAATQNDTKTMSTKYRIIHREYT